MNTLSGNIDTLPKLHYIYIELSEVQDMVGSQGVSGISGIQGMTGMQGPTGICGNQGIYSFIIEENKTFTLEESINNIESLQEKELNIHKIYE